MMQLNQQKLLIQHKPVRKIFSNDDSNNSSIDTKSIKNWYILFINNKLK